MPTLADLLARAELELSPVGVSTGTDREVRWVAVSDLSDPSPYLEGGELLLTTGLLDQDWADWVTRVDAVGVTAIGFGVGLSHETVPVDLAAAAAAAHLPLLSVPERTPFLAIGRAVAELLAVEERTQTQRAFAVQQELTRAITRPDGVERVLRVLAGTAGGRAGLIDRDGTAVLPSGFRVPTAARRAVDTLRTAPGRAAVTETDGGTTTIVQPLSSGGPFLVLETSTPPDGVVRTVLVTTVALLTLDADRRRATHEAEARLREGAVGLLLRGDVDAARGVAALVDGASVPDPLRVIRVRGEGLRVTALPPTVLGGRTFDDGTVAVVLPADDEQAVLGALTGPGIRAGVGPAVPADRAGHGDEAARAALVLTTPERPTVRWEDRGRGRVLDVLPDPVAAALATTLLGELEREPVLLATLEAYLRHLGRWAPTGDELGIHRNTLRKRIVRVAALTGLDPDTAAGRADLWIALSARGDRAEPPDLGPP